jgi:hypothetical protein
MAEIASLTNALSVSPEQASGVRIFLAHAESEKPFVARVKDAIVSLSRSKRVRRASGTDEAPIPFVYYDKDNFSASRDGSLGTFAYQAADSTILLLFVAKEGIHDDSYVVKELLAFLTANIRHHTRYEPNPEALSAEEQATADSRIGNLLIVDRHSALMWSDKREGPAGLPAICRTGCLRQWFETERPRLRANSSEPIDIAVATLALAWKADPEKVHSRAEERRRLITAAAIGIGAIVTAVLIGTTVYAVRQATVAREAQQRAEVAANGERHAKTAAQTSEKRALAAASAERAARDAAESAATAERSALEAERREHGLAEERARIARAEAYGSAAYAYSLQDPTLALRLAEESLKESPNTTAQLAVLRAFNSGSWFYSERFDGADDAVFSEDGSTFAWTDTKSNVHVRRREGLERKWSIDTGSVGLTSLANLSLSSSGDVIVWAARSGVGALGTLTIWNASGQKQKTFEGRFLGAYSCGGNTMIIADYADYRVQRAGKGQAPIMRIIDVAARAEQAHLGPEQQGTFERITDVACTPHAKRIVLTSGNEIFARAEWGGYRRFSAPECYLALDAAISPDGKHAAAYLRAGRQGQQDGIATLDLETFSFRVVALAEAPTGDSGGKVSFIDPDRVVAASTAGWTRVVNLKTGAIESLIPKERGTDQIATCPTTGDFAIARRSGSVVVFDRTGSPIARLLGHAASDGLNVNFRRVAFDADKGYILTAAKDGVRIWRRPQEPLVRAVDTVDFMSDAPASSFKKAFDGPGVAGPCRDPLGSMMDSLSIDDSGFLSLCLRLTDRNDLLATGLTQKEFSPVVVPRAKDRQSMAAWFSSTGYIRLFALEPARVLQYLQRREVMWAPTSVQLAGYIH